MLLISALSYLQETVLHNNTLSFQESLSAVVHEQCSCNFTSINMEDSQLTCLEDGSRATFTTTVVYSSDNGDMIASHMINTIQSWAAVNGADATIELGGVTATVSQVCSPSCDSPTSSISTGGVITGTLFGGFLGGIILLGIPVAIVW